MSVITSGTEREVGSCFVTEIFHPRETDLREQKKLSEGIFSLCIPTAARLFHVDLKPLETLLFTLLLYCRPN